MSSLEVVGKLLSVGIVLLILYLVIAGGVTLAYYTRTGQGETDGFWYQPRQKWIPKSWLKWAGYPAVFSNTTQINVTNMSVLKTVSGTEKQCMLACEAENDRKSTNCVGFVHEKTASANTCYLATTMDGLLANTVTSNIVYFISGFDTAKQFYLNAGKSMSTAGYSTVSTTSLNACASNCTSNVLCNGFTFTGSSCALYSNMDETKFVAQTGTDSYPKKDHQPLTSVDVTYWKN
jgi:hypothetical protein